MSAPRVWMGTEGIVHVDYATLQRTPKDSYLWYREFLLEQQRARQQALAV